MSRRISLSCATLVVTAVLVAGACALLLGGLLRVDLRYAFTAGALCCFVLSVLAPLVAIMRMQATLSNRMLESSSETVKQTALAMSTELHAMHVLLARFPECSLLTSSYSIRFANLLAIVDILDRNQPTHVVELGSGMSTVCIAAWIRERGLGGKITSFDHDPAWAAITLNHLRRTSLEKYADIHVTPLGPINKESGLQWYDLCESLNSLSPVDVLLVDGPPAGSDERGLARLPALTAFKDLLQENTIILLDDYSRPGEKAVMKEWAKSMPSHEVLDIPSLSGLSVLSPRPRK